MVLVVQPDQCRQCRTINGECYAACPYQEAPEYVHLCLMPRFNEGIGRVVFEPSLWDGVTGGWGKEAEEAR